MTVDLILASVSFVLSFLICAVITRFLIPKLKSLKMGQKILDIGPRWHKGKEGTPTMGGIAMLVSSLCVMIVYVLVGVITGIYTVSFKLVTVVSYGLLNGMIGIIDDRVKLLKKENAGLTAIQKYSLQFVCAAIFVAVMRICGFIDTTLHIPFTSVRLELGVFYYIIAVLLLTGVVNAVNLTDGIDGLASSVTLIVGCFFAVCAVTKMQGEGISVLGGVLAGVCGGFLVYNFYPAKIFMGDTGSLFLGGIVIGGAFMLGSPLAVILFGLIYIVETLSVILQVASFKLTGKRIFKMAPIHHHFEMCGWSEIKIVTVASVITSLFCILSYFAV